MSQAQIARLTQKYIQQHTSHFLDLLDQCSEEQVWKPPSGGGNSMGTLAHHLAGNYRQYFGAGLLKNGYKRQREREFSDRGIDKKTLRENLLGALDIMTRALSGVTEEQAHQPHTTPDERFFDELGILLMHLATHCAYHTGQASFAVRGIR